MKTLGDIYETDLSLSTPIDTFLLAPLCPCKNQNGTQEWLAESWAALVSLTDGSILPQKIYGDKLFVGKLSTIFTAIHKTRSSQPMQPVFSGKGVPNQVWIIGDANGCAVVILRFVEMLGVTVEKSEVSAGMDIGH